MADVVKLPIEISARLLAKAEAAAAWRDMSLAVFLTEVITRASEADLALAASIQEGIDCIERGETYTQEEMEAWFEARHGQAAAE